MARKPYDAEVEYIESSGTQYINTGIAPDSTTIMDAYGLFLQGSSGTRLGVRDNGGTNNFAANNTNTTTIRIDLGSVSGTNWSVGTTQNLDRIQIDAANKSATVHTVDGTTLSHTFTSSAPSGSRAITIFAYNNAGNLSSRATGMRIYALKIWKSGVLVRDFIPVRVGTEGCLYDAVSGTIFRNAGTGVFAYGSDVGGGNIGSKRIASVRRVVEKIGGP